MERPQRSNLQGCDDNAHLLGKKQGRRETCGVCGASIGENSSQPVSTIVSTCRFTSDLSTLRSENRSCVGSSVRKSKSTLP